METSGSGKTNKPIRHSRAGAGLEPVEVTRARYRPDKIPTLFVGESAPASGAFFYHGDSAMLRYMRRATEAALGVGSGEFLDRFKASGWFLDDLVLTPVNACQKCSAGRNA